MLARPESRLLVFGLALLGCDTEVDTSDLPAELQPAAGETVKRTSAHASCSGTDVRLEYKNAAGEAVASCFGLKQDTQICSLATCESSSDLSESERRRIRKDKKRRRKKR